jgi:hypothetical protein
MADVPWRRFDTACGVLFLSGTGKDSALFRISTLFHFCDCDSRFGFAGGGRFRASVAARLVADCVGSHLVVVHYRRISRASPKSDPEVMFMRLEDAIFDFEIFSVAVVLIAALVGFIFVQIKARPIWRLSSLALVLIGSCWACSFYTHLNVATKFLDSYCRGSREFVTEIDQMTLQNRTNDVHQACQAYLDAFWTEDNTTDFDAMVTHTLDLANQQPITAPPEPTATAPSVSTNK